MGRGIRLTHEELNLIDLLRLKTLSKDVFRNCLIITMSHFASTDYSSYSGGPTSLDCSQLPRSRSPIIQPTCRKAILTGGLGPN